MNKYQHLVQKQFLNNEEEVIKRLKGTYKDALDDVTKKAKKLQDDITGIDLKISLTQDPDEIAKLKSMRQAKVYQKKYQESLKKQVGDILDTMHKESFKTVSEYLYKSYEDGFIGTLYDLQGQGIPLAFPLDQEAMVRAVQLDSKISNGLYSHLGEDVSLLKKRITAEISRGISAGATFQQIAKQLSLKMTGTYENPGGSLAYAMRIARTEGHRIQIQGTMDACHKAKSKGADVVKQWDSTLDGRTRESHQMVDGEIKELDEKFSNGLRFPGDPSGGAAEVVNCRCALLQRARWGLDEEELETLKERAEYFGLDKSDSFEDYKKKYLKMMEEESEKPLTKSGKSDKIIVPKTSSDDNYNKLLAGVQKNGVDYLPVESHSHTLSEADIIAALSGGDKTGGSCASVGLAYIGQKQGWDVLDFRGGASRDFYSRSFNLHTLSQMKGLKVLKGTGASALTVGNRLVKQCEIGKEYYLCVGRHASIVRKTPEGVLQYLELQSSSRSGWTDFDKNARHTLNWRFGCTSSSDYGCSQAYDFMIDISESDFAKDDDFRTLLGYINTSAGEQRKGSSGTIK